MQVRFLELLEGLPEEVQSALLDLAYERVVRDKLPDAEVNYSAGCWTVVRRVGHKEYSKTCLTTLEAWKDAYARLKQ